MTEIKGEYWIAHPNQDEVIQIRHLQCRGCGEYIGQLTIKGDLKPIYLLIGNMRVTSIQSTCGTCGERFTWWAGDVRLERLTKKRVD